MPLNYHGLRGLAVSDEAVSAKTYRVNKKRQGYQKEGFQYWS